MLQVGFEGNDGEKWLEYFPETNKLDLTDWLEELKAQADWDVWRDHYIPTATELERRLRCLVKPSGRNPLRT